MEVVAAFAGEPFTILCTLLVVLISTLVHVLLQSYRGRRQIQENVEPQEEPNPIAPPEVVVVEHFQAPPPPPLPVVPKAPYPRPLPEVAPLGVPLRFGLEGDHPPPPPPEFPPEEAVPQERPRAREKGKGRGRGPIAYPPRSEDVV